MAFFDTARFTRKDVLPGIRVGSVSLEKLMLTHFVFKAGAVVPEHAHPHEQISFVVSGELEFTLSGETRLVGPGEGAAVPAGALHRVTAVTDVEVIDCWHPVRADYVVPETVPHASADGS